MFKEKLKQLRIERNLTQADIAKAIGVSPATIGNYEQGTREPKNNEMWQKLADYFGVSVDALMAKNNDIDTSKIGNSVSPSKKEWMRQYRDDINIIYNGADITSLVHDRADDKTPITLKQQFAYTDYLGRSGHVIYARKKLLCLLNQMRQESKEEISENLSRMIKYVENNVVYWYKRCWSNIDDLFPTANSLETFYDLLNKCLCVDIVAQREFTLIPLDENFDWLREKLRS